MSSGFGIKGNVGRCYTFFQSYEECLSKAGEVKECYNNREDYFECLHHKKEFTRVKTIEAQRKKNEEEGGGGH